MFKDFDLREKVEREYTMWFNHIRNEIERKRTILDRVLDPTLPDWQVRIPLLWKNIQLELALYLTDDINIQILTNWWVLWEEIMKNANLVLKYDDTDMDLYEMREDIINHNAVYWLSATIVDNWDDEEKQPISDVISPLNLIIDPKNYKGSKLRFIWVRRRVNLDWIKWIKWFDKSKISELEGLIDTEISKTERWINNSNRQTNIEDNDWMIDIYDHFTIYKWKKILTTWWADRTILLRYVELEGLTEAEQLKPTKIKFPIQLHRRKPKFWSVMWVSIADEVLVFQDIISQLINLQIINARIQSLWADLFVDDKIGIDTSMLSQWKPGWRVLPISNKTWLPTQNWLFYNQIPTPSKYTDVLIQSLEQRAEETTSISKQNFWITQQGQQTKAEIQTLQQNANNILSWIWNNYLRWQKDYWTAHYKSYCLNMWKWSKFISMFQKWQAVSLELKKQEFIADWKVQIIVVSKEQEAIENDKEFNKLAIITQTYLPNITSEYAKNSLLRLIGNKSNVRDFDSSKYIRESLDEIKAKRNLELLNNNIEVPPPEMNDNAEVYIDIYKQAMNTQAKYKALEQYYAFAEFKATQQAQQMTWQWNWQILNTAMNNENSKAQSVMSAQPWL